MKVKIILVTILMNLMISICSEAIRNYPQIEVHKIKAGNGEGEIGIDFRRTYVAAEPGPSAFALNNDLIYVCDYINARINVYDSDWNFLRKIADKEYAGVSYSDIIKLDDMGNILVFDHNRSLVKIDKTGKMLLKIPGEKISDGVSSGNFFPYDDKILFYDSRNKNRNEMEIKFYDKNGEILDKDQTSKIVNNAEESALSRTSVFESVDTIENKVKKVIENKDIMIDKAPLTISFSIFREYFEMLKGSQLKSLSNRSNKQKEIKDAVEFDFPEFGQMYPNYIGFDSDGNSYWQNYIFKSKPRLFIIIVCSPYGEILDAFYNPILWRKVAIAPNGDVYFLSYDKEWVYFHKIERVW